MSLIDKKLAQQIVNTVKDVCGKDVNFIEPSGIISASTNEQRIGTYHEIGQKAAASGTTIEVDTDDTYSGTYKGVNLPISHNHAIVAVIGISGIPDEVRVYAHLAEQITRLLIREKELNSISRADSDKKHYVLDSMINSRELNHDYLLDCFNDWKISTETKKRIILIEISSKYNPVNLSMLEQKIYNIYNNINVQLYAYYYPNIYIALIDDDDYLNNHHKIEKFAASYVKMLKTSIGRSVPYHQLERSYQSALTTSNSLTYDGNNYAVFDSMELEIILSCVNDEHRQEYMDKITGKLDEDEIQLLNIYYRTNMSLADTCERLFIHKNTLQYRLDKIYKKTGKNPRDFEDAVKIYLALKLRKTHTTV